MQIIFTFIPAKTSVADLQAFALSGLGPRWAFWNRSKIRSCEILNMRDETRATREHHGLVSFENAEDAEKVIANLNGKPLHGKPVEVRQYFNRSPSDRRKTRSAGGRRMFLDARRPRLLVWKGPATATPSPALPDGEPAVDGVALDEGIEASSELLRTLSPRPERVTPEHSRELYEDYASRHAELAFSDSEILSIDHALERHAKPVARHTGDTVHLRPAPLSRDTFENATAETPDLQFSPSELIALREALPDSTPLDEEGGIYPDPLDSTGTASRT